MEGSKIKNIVLLILLVVNVFLLVQVVDQEHRSARYEAETRQTAVEVLARQGVALGLDKLPEERSLPALNIGQRDKAGEEAMARSLLGEPLSASEQGGPAAYGGQSGQGLFFSNGRFSFTFDRGLPLDGEEPKKQAVRLMGAAGYEAVVLESVQDTDSGETKVTLCQLFSGERVFNYRAELTYRDGALWAIEGQRLTGTPTAEEGSGEGISVSTVLIRFLGGIQENGYLCSEIRDLRLGYHVTMEAGGTGALTPVWLVATDGGSFYVNAGDGGLTVAE